MPNLLLYHWSSQLFDLRAPSSIDVPVLLLNQPDRPFPSSVWPLYQNEVKYSAFGMEMIFHSHADKLTFTTKVLYLASF